MADSLNICLISREFPPDTAFGGIAIFSLDTALMLRGQGHQVTVFSQSLGPSHILEYQGLIVHKIQVPRFCSSYNNLPIFILAFNAVVMSEVIRCHRTQPFDLIDVPDHLAEGLFSTLFLDIPVITRLHTPYSLIVEMGLNNYKKSLSFFLIKMMEKIALSRSDALYAPCADIVRLSKNLLSFGQVPVEIFGYPLDLTLFSPQHTETHDGPPRILFIGRLEQRKGIETIAEAFPKVFSACPDARLTLLGNDTPNIRGFSSAKEYLRDFFGKAQCVKNVTFSSHISLDQLPSVLRCHDVIWIPSIYDNYPLICLEAMACGKAVIVSNAGGLPEIVRHGETGLVFNKGDSDSLAKLTLELFYDLELAAQLGQNARKYALEHCSLDSIYDRTMQLYQSVLSH